MATTTNIKVRPEGHLKTSSTAQYHPKEAHFAVYQDEAKSIFGHSPAITLVLEDEKPLFHEAGVFFPSRNGDKLFITSNQFERNGAKTIQISLLTRKDNASTWTREDISDGEAVMANGAVNCPDMRSLLICAQGSREHIGGLVKMSFEAPYRTELVLTNYHGRRFNSVNDVIYAKDGSIWFTDPDYGFEQSIRPESQLPNQIYRYDEALQDVRVVADGLAKPNGLCFSPDEETLYVTDTDHIHGDGDISLKRASHIYAYTVKSFHGKPFLTEKRVFAMADNGVPDGIKCDTQGRVYSGCGDGINIWSADGTLLGKIMVPGGAANFCFGRPGEVFILNETRFWVAQIDQGIKGDLLKGKI